MKRTFSALLVFVLAFIMCFSVCAVTLDVAENAADVTVVSEADLAEDTTPTYTPGLNIYTGTTAPFDFEGADASIKTTIVGDTGRYDERDLNLVTVSDADFVVKATADNENNTAMCLAGSYPHFGFQMKVLPVIEAKRPVQVSFKYISDGSSKIRFIRNTLNKTSPSLGGPDMTSTSDTWVKYSTKIVGTSSAVTNNAKPASYCKDDTQDIKTLIFMKPTDDTANIWIDDLAVVPYYKITYIGLDGETVAATEYVLLDANGDVIKHYIPDLSKVEGATGYALTQGGERISDVALNNADVTLYALNTNVVTLSNGKADVNFTVDGEFTFPVAEDVFEGINNFLVYSDGTSFYKEGDKADAADVIGKTFTAVCTTYKEFDETYGELIYYTNYDLMGVDTVPGSSVSSGAIKPSYKNNSFIPGDITHTDGNAILTADVTSVDGNRVLKFATKNNNVYNYWCVLMLSTVAGKYIAFEDVRAEDTQGIDLATQFNKAWHRMGHGSSYQTTNYTVNPSADWQTFATSSLVSATGIKYSGYSYNRASSSMLPNVYKDNHAVYCYPSYTIYFKDAKASTDYIKDVLDTSAGNPTTYTFPTPVELGYETKEFVAWTNGTKYYKAGEETALANVQYTVFYPFYQNADAPAMGFTFEGDKKENSFEVSKAVYTKNIVDDGRDVLLVHWFNGYGGTGSSYPTDLRLSFLTSTYSDPSEYNIIQYSTKVDRAWDVIVDGTIVKNNDSGKPYWADKTQNPTYKAVTSKPARIFAHTKANGTYLSPVISVGNPAVAVSDSYSIYEYDKSGAEDFTSLAGYGFCVDPFQATFGANVYIDYVRVYRKGIQTITYATNAPVGATVVKEVAADTNRGLGYGYLLKDVRPVVEGYVFLGWGLTPDATETVNSITVDGDETVYAVWAEADTVNTPEVTEEVEIRGNGDNDTNGIRFKSAIKPSEKANLDEFGFLATREVLLPYADAEKTTRNHDYLTFNHKVNGEDKNYYVQGVAYDADGDIDLINSEKDDGGIIYTAVVTGIPLENKAEKMVVRSYAKYTVNGKEMVVYGNTNAASLYDVATSIKDAGGEAYTNNQTYIESILSEKAE